MLEAHREQANEYTHYSDPNHGFLTPLQSILMNAKKEELLNILSVYLVNTNARVDFHVVGNPPLYMAIAVSGCIVLAIRHAHLQCTVESHLSELQLSG